MCICAFVCRYIEAKTSELMPLCIHAFSHISHTSDAPGCNFLRQQEHSNHAK